MRTTVTLDPDVEKLLRRAVRARGESFKQVLNDALRDGLLSAGARTARARPFRQRTFDLGAPKIDLTKALTLADALGDAARLAKLRARP